MINTELQKEIASIEDRIIILNNYPALLDRDVAKFYGVETKYINQAVKNNPNKFPEGYVFELSIKDTNALRSKFLTLENKTGLHTKYRAKVFTEKGLYMLATILKGERATQVTLNIIETFAKFRSITNDLLEANKTDDKEKKAGFLARSGENLINLLTKEIDLTTTSTKTTIKLDLGIFKIEKIIEKEK